MAQSTFITRLRPRRRMPAAASSAPRPCSERRRRAGCLARQKGSFPCMPGGQLAEGRAWGRARSAFLGRATLARPVQHPKPADAYRRCAPQAAALAPLFLVTLWGGPANAWSLRRGPAVAEVSLLPLTRCVHMLDPSATPTGKNRSLAPGAGLAGRRRPPRVHACGAAEPSGPSPPAFTHTGRGGAAREGGGPRRRPRRRRGPRRRGRRGRRRARAPRGGPGQRRRLCRRPGAAGGGPRRRRALAGRRPRPRRLRGRGRRGRRRFAARDGGDDGRGAARAPARAARRRRRARHQPGALFV
jgi:hypothetical protein